MWTGRGSGSGGGGVALVVALALALALALVSVQVCRQLDIFSVKRKTFPRLAAYSLRCINHAIRSHKHSGGCRTQ
jgi:hypothetical protein